MSISITPTTPGSDRGTDQSDRHESDCDDERRPQARTPDQPGRDQDRCHPAQAEGGVEVPGPRPSATEDGLG